MKRNYFKVINRNQFISVLIYLKTYIYINNLWNIDSLSYRRYSYLKIVYDSYIQKNMCLYLIGKYLITMGLNKSNVVLYVLDTICAVKTNGCNVII